MIKKAASFSKALDVYWDRELVGKLMQGTSGSLSFVYSDSFLEKAQRGVSISLPLKEKVFEGNVVRAFFSGLLPEESVRLRLARYMGVSDKNSFALLQAIGGECAGALALYPEGQTPPSEENNDVEVLDEDKLSEIINLIKSRPFLVREDLRLSLAGAQDKLAVGFENNHVLLIKSGNPTTHILKPIIERVADSVYNEFFCMRLAKRVGIEVPFASVHFANEVPYYIVERYDRIKQKDGRIIRLHQEDFCQALGVLPELKYEREGGPSIKKCQQLILEHCLFPAADQLKFLKIVLFNYLIGNADAHGKNFSFLYRKQKPELAPAYDLMSTALYPDLSSKMAMKIGGTYKSSEVCLRNWYRLVPETKSAQSMLKKQMNLMAHHTLEGALELKKELEIEGLKSNALEGICKIIEERSKELRLT